MPFWKRPKPEDDRDILVDISSTPEIRAPGSPLRCWNVSDEVRVGDRVDLVTALRAQTTSIVSIEVDGVPADRLAAHEEGVLRLGPEADLSDVYRSSNLLPAGEGVSPDDFCLEIHTFVQQDADAYVTGPARGTITPGRRVVVTPYDEQTVGNRFSRVDRVDDLSGGVVGLLLQGRDASALKPGDQASWFPGLPDESE